MIAVAEETSKELEEEDKKDVDNAAVEVRSQKPAEVETEGEDKECIDEYIRIIPQFKLKYP